MMDIEQEMDRAFEMDGEKLRQLTGEDHGPWKSYEPDYDDMWAEIEALDIAAQEAAQRDNEQAITRVRSYLSTDTHNTHIVATTVSLRQAAGETPSAFVRRIVAAWLEEAMS